MTSPAQKLTGMRLDGGWTVKSLIPRAATATGGYFSQGYTAESVTGEKAFLKALDFSEALTSPDPARALQALTEAYNFERDLLQKCTSNRLSRIIRVLGHGTVQVPPGGGINAVQYLILEFAGSGDIRKQQGRRR